MYNYKAFITLNRKSLVKVIIKKKCLNVAYYFKVFYYYLISISNYFKVKIFSKGQVISKE